MPTEQILELARRCEEATAEQQRELLNEAYYALFPEPNTERERRFQAMLDAEAYESAAMALVPGGWRVSMAYEKLSGWALRLTRGFAPGATTADRAMGEASAFALALCAAALRAMEASNAQQ